MQDFRKLKVWQSSHELVHAAYRASSRFPPSETYALTGQLRRAAVSIPANVSEGCGRGSRPDFAHFLHIAMGSASEAQCLLLLARDLPYLPGDAHTALDGKAIEIKRMLTALLKRVSPGSGGGARPGCTMPRTDN